MENITLENLDISNLNKAESLVIIGLLLQSIILREETSLADTDFYGDIYNKLIENGV